MQEEEIHLQTLCRAPRRGLLILYRRASNFGHLSFLPPNSKALELNGDAGL